MFPSQPCVSVSTAVSVRDCVGRLEQQSQVSQLAAGDRRELLGSPQRRASGFFHLGACEPRGESRAVLQRNVRSSKSRSMAARSASGTTIAEARASSMETPAAVSSINPINADTLATTSRAGLFERNDLAVLEAEDVKSVLGFGDRADLSRL